MPNTRLKRKRLAWNLFPSRSRLWVGWVRAQALIKELADHAAEHTAFSRAEALQLLVQGAAMAVQRGNAYLLTSAFQRCSNSFEAEESALASEANRAMAGFLARRDLVARGGPPCRS